MLNDAPIPFDTVFFSFIYEEVLFLGNSRMITLISTPSQG